MPRPATQLTDGLIVDRAAALFARRGSEQTSVQAVADAVGLSKAGLLHHYPSKDGLRAAVLDRARTLADSAVAAVAHLPLGPARDRRALEVLLDVALAHPGLVALILSPVASGAAEPTDADLDAVARAALQAFGVDPDTADPERHVRVAGALSALAVLALGAHQHGQAATWRPLVLATSYDALGHPRPGATRSDVEA